MTTKVVLAAIFFFFGLCAAKVSYHGSQVWRVEKAVEGDQLGHALQWEELVERLNLDVWAESMSHLDVMVKPNQHDEVKKGLDRLDLQHSIAIQDVGRMIEEEEESLNIGPGTFNLTDFNTFEDIEIFLAEVAATNQNATLTSIGTTLEGRDLWQLKFSVGAGKPAIWIDCGIHAREWITESTCLWGIDFINNNYGSDPDVTALLDAYDVYILSVVNPDGYSYTWTEDRLWRKNRNPNSNGNCYGIDLNRNFDDGVWGGAGSSNLECQETYHGASAASEAEIQSVQARMTELSETANLGQVYSIHSYSQYWMYAHAYTNERTEGTTENDRVATIGVNALTSVYGTEYTYGDWYTVLYPSTGTTLDFAFNRLSIIHSYTIELRPERAIQGGFQISADEIVPVAIETWTGMMAAIMAV